jgi:hypothetical protein
MKRNKAVQGVVALLMLIGQACATAPAKPSGPVELHGTRWKLLIVRGAIDGRVIEFQRRGTEGYYGNLVASGRQLQDVVGLEMGRRIFTLRKQGVNQYEGIYVSLERDGAIGEREVVVFIDGDNMTWNQESAVWERQR